MRKFICGLFLVISVNSCFAIDQAEDYQMTGHLTTLFGELVYDAFGQCIHTAFYSAEENALVECGETNI